MLIIIYNGTGVSKGSVESLESALERHFPIQPSDTKATSHQPQILKLDSHGLILNHQYLTSTNDSLLCDALFIPGGRDIPYLQAWLRPTGIEGGKSLLELIREYVELRGGKVFATCAGAYASCSQISWSASPYCFVNRNSDGFITYRDGEDFPTQSMKLALPNNSYHFLAPPGITAVGTLDRNFPEKFGHLPPFQYGSESGASILTLKITDSHYATNNGLVNVYYNGGCTFVGMLGADSGVKVLASFVDPKTLMASNLPAILSFELGTSGRVILSGVHPEFHLLDSKKDAERIILWKYLISQLFEVKKKIPLSSTVTSSSAPMMSNTSAELNGPFPSALLLFIFLYLILFKYLLK